MQSNKALASTDKPVEAIFTHDFLLVFSAQLIVSAVYCILIPTLPLHFSQLGFREKEIGVLIGIQGLSSLLLRPFVGRALQSISEKAFMMGGALLFLVSSGIFLSVHDFWPILSGRVLQGIGIAFFYTAAVSMIADISPEGRLGQSMSYYLLSFNIPLALAPMIGMFLVHSYGFNSLFVACTGLSLLALSIPALLGKRPEGGRPEELAGRNRSFFNRKALPPSIVAFTADMIWGALIAFFPLYAIANGMGNPGFFFGAFALMTILGRGFGARFIDRYSRGGVISVSLVAYIIGMALLIFFKSPPVFLGVAVIWGIGHAFLFPALVAYAIEKAGASRGPAIGTFTALEDLGMGLGPVLSGFVLHWAGYRSMFAGLLFLALINLGFFWVFVRTERG